MTLSGLSIPAAMAEASASRLLSIDGLDLHLLAGSDFASVADSALEYYDGLYDAYAASSQREHVLHVECAEAGQASDAQRVLHTARTFCF